MIKLRLHGTEEDVERMATDLCDMPGWRVLSESADYPDRGRSVLLRRYLDMEPEKVEK